MMRAKLQITKVETHKTDKGETLQETVSMMPVTSKPFNPDGENEDNTFARWTPGGTVSLTISNPKLFGKFTEGQRFYADFTPAAD
jgi:hypothetical protein